MMREILSLSPLNQGRLVAGERGLGREVRWVTIVEVLEDVERLQPGELLVTTAYQLTEDPEGRRAYVRRLADRRLAGLAVIAGLYLDEVPVEMIDEADRCGLPVIQLPPTVNFSDITQAVLGRLVNRQYELLRASEQVHSELTRLALDGAELEDIAAVMRRLTGAELAFWDETGGFLGGDEDEGVQEVLDGLLEGPGSSGDVDSAPLPTLRFRLRDGECLIAPMRAGARLFGYVTLANLHTELRELDRVALGHAATVSSLLLSRREAVAAERTRLRGEFLDEVLQARASDRPVILARAPDFGCRLDRPHVALLVGDGRTDDGDAPGEGQAGGMEPAVTAAEVRLGRREGGFLLRSQKDQILVFVEAESAEEAGRAAEDLLLIEEVWGRPLRIGVGGVSEDLRDFRRSSRQAEIAYRLGPLAGADSGVVLYERLGLFRTAVELEHAGVSLEDLCRTSLGELAEDGERPQRLRETLDAFFQNNGNLQATADALYVHRHTLRYRLQRVEELTGRDLKDSMDRLDLQLGVVLYRYLEATRDGLTNGEAPAAG